MERDGLLGAAQLEGAPVRGGVFGCNDSAYGGRVLVKLVHGKAVVFVASAGIGHEILRAGCAACVAASGG